MSPDTPTMPTTATTAAANPADPSTDPVAGDTAVPPGPNPADAVAGDEPMTPDQRAYLQALCEDAGEAFNGNLSKEQASRHIDALRERAGHGSLRTSADAGRTTGQAEADSAVEQTTVASGYTGA